MASLYKRANPLQKQMLKIIEGAVMNAYHAHPEPQVNMARFARGVAKRAVGTLTAHGITVECQKPDVLAEDDMTSVTHEP